MFNVLPDILRPFVKLFAIGGVVAALFTWFAVEQRNKGASRAIAKVETNNGKLAKAASDAGRKSLAGDGGLRNPHYRD